MNTNQRRLRPSTLVRTDFARLLAAHFVPTQIPSTAVEGGPLDNNTLACRVPPVCAEFFANWVLAGRPLHGLKLETVARMARDAYLAEGGRRTLAFDVEQSEAALRQLRFGR